MSRAREPSLGSSVSVVATLSKEATPDPAASPWRSSARRRSGARHRVHPRSTEPGPALPCADQADPSDPGLCRSGRDAAMAGADPIAAELWQAEFGHYRRFDGSSGKPTARSSGRDGRRHEKIVSLFEPHIDIIVKGGREVEYGDKLNLTSGRSGLILDLVIEAGNPADSERFCPRSSATSPSMASASTNSRRWWFRKPSQPRRGEGPRRPRRGVPQEGRPARHGHGQKQRGLSQAAQFPSRHRIRHLVFEARLWSGTLRLARARPFQGLRLVLSRRLQPRPLRPAQADLTPRLPTNAREAG